MFVCYCVPKKLEFTREEGKLLNMLFQILFLYKNFGLSICATHHKRLCGRI